MTQVTLSTVAATVTDEIKSFRSAAVTSENRSTPFVRSLLASVVSGSTTVSLLEASIVHAFGNPKNAKGKGIATVSGLRAFVGGTATYQAWKSFVTLTDCIDGDKAVDVGEGVMVGAGAIRADIVAFILQTDGCAANLKQLLERMDAALKAFFALTAPANDDAIADNDEQAALAAKESGEISHLSLNDRALALLVAFQTASNDERDAAYDTIGLIVDAMNAAIEADAKPELEAVA